MQLRYLDVLQLIIGYMVFFCGTKAVVVFQSYTQLKAATLSPGLLQGEREKKVFFSFSSYKDIQWDKVSLKKLTCGRYYHFYAGNIDYSRDSPLRVIAFYYLYLYLFFIYS